MPVRASRRWLLAALLLGCCSGDFDARLAEWLGPQKVEGDLQRRKLGLYEVKASIVLGTDVHFAVSENPTITCESGRIVARTTPSVEKSKKYLVAVLQLSAQRGWRIYDCVLRITAGPLKGAIVTVCERTRFPPSITDAYQAYYEVPENIRVGEGALEFEVVVFWGK